MEDQPSTQVPRRYPRFRAQPRTLIQLAEGPEALPYHVIDISEGGLSFSYLGDKIKPAEVFPVNLYHENELILGSLPAKAVSDCRMHGTYVSVRRGSLCFESLSAEQRALLSSFVARFSEKQH